MSDFRVPGFENINLFYTEKIQILEKVEEKLISKEVLQNQEFRNLRHKLYGIVNDNSLHMFLQFLENSILGILLPEEEYLHFFIYISCFFESINILTYFIKKYSITFHWNSYYFIRLTIRFNLKMTFNYILIEQNFNFLEDPTENGNSLLCEMIIYNRIDMICKVLNTLDSKTQTLECLKLVQLEQDPIERHKLIKFFIIHDYINFKYIEGFTCNNLVQGKTSMDSNPSDLDKKICIINSR